MRDERFWARVDTSAGPDGCWIWQGPRFHFGHGAACVRGKQYRAHRYAWMESHGPIPAGMCVLHRCDNPPCCNPAHLFLGTKADNNRDMMAKGRHKPGFAGHFKTHCKFGHLLPPPSEQTPDGHRPCRICNAAKSQRYRERNMESVKEASRNYQRERRARLRAERQQQAS